MGSPLQQLSPIVAELAFQYLESHILKKLSFTPSFYIRYVDDIALAAPYSLIDDLLNNFNPFHPRLKFTMEIGGTSLNFLESKIINRDGQLIFDWYHKLTFSGRFLNYYSKLDIPEESSNYEFDRQSLILITFWVPSEEFFTFDQYSIKQ